MRGFYLAAVIAISLLLGGGSAIAAELVIPPRKATQETTAPQTTKPPREISMQQGPTNCLRWTDECVNCMRGAAGEVGVLATVSTSTRRMASSIGEAETSAGYASDVAPSRARFCARSRGNCRATGFLSSFAT